MVVQVNNQDMYFVAVALVAQRQQAVMLVIQTTDQEELELLLQ
jgi:hypothetical protein